MPKCIAITFSENICTILIHIQLEILICVVNNSCSIRNVLSHDNLMHYTNQLLLNAQKIINSFIHSLILPCTFYMSLLEQASSHFIKNIIRLLHLINSLVVLTNDFNCL